mmetsp:Transcript_35433/g.54212  ORF Transcript_35433/g.54212 Transcript_35433/m.54212 type:complete len:115 (+) Transcript_35433:1375-1719(+)
MSPENQIRKLGYYHGKGGQKQVPPMAIPADLSKVPKPQSRPQQHKRKRSKPRPVKVPQSQISHDINAVTSPHSDYHHIHQSQSSKRSLKGEEITITEEHPQVNSQAVSQMDKPF